MANLSVSKITVLVLASFGLLSIISILLVVVLFLIYKPLGIEIQNVPGAIIKSQSGNPVSTYDHPLLTTEQESTLESLGIDTSSLPTTITEAQLICFSGKLGEARAQEIANGSPVTANDYFKARSCIK